MVRNRNEPQWKSTLLSSSYTLFCHAGQSQYKCPISTRRNRQLDRSYLWSRACIRYEHNSCAGRQMGSGYSGKIILYNINYSTHWTKSLKQWSDINPWPYSIFMIADFGVAGYEIIGRFGSARPTLNYAPAMGPFTSSISFNLTLWNFGAIKMIPAWRYCYVFT